jgi:hypothetical protein
MSAASRARPGAAAEAGRGRRIIGSVRNAKPSRERGFFMPDSPRGFETSEPAPEGGSAHEAAPASAAWSGRERVPHRIYRRVPSAVPSGTQAFPRTPRVSIRSQFRLFARRYATALSATQKLREEGLYPALALPSSGAALPGCAACRPALPRFRLEAFGLAFTSIKRRSRYPARELHRFCRTASVGKPDRRAPRHS